MKKISAIPCLFIVLFIACNKGNNQARKEASIIYEPKPLANLMLRMHGDALVWKGAIELGEFSAEFPVDYNGIYTLEATDSSVRTDVFEEKAGRYLQSVEALCLESNTPQHLEKFNLMIVSCVDCHQIFCQGPIVKIEKLYLEESL